MKNLKKIAVLALLLIGFFAFSKAEKTTSKTSLNIDAINIVKALSNQELECRPTSNFLFYVEATLVKKSRGSSTVNATIFVLDRVSGQYNSVANENIVVPFHKESVLQYDIVKSNCNKITLANGDKIIGSTQPAAYCFSDLIKYEVVFNSYNSAINKLLHINRTL
ncbi:hypothetical protein [Polaribacter glomeratus]|uniref:Uncharacterized protein n=1 Tax=Polaribacter glomeratus TaxID=102 RepID=A0A2S7WUL7_9FLAO|nr:hypothetical protein [Polaribacter glomeratus]PQJ81294.1 hypothetical protein BTO16_01295 [Polaribacter glomeratus]TXD63573.1 hypothetical protein ESX12_17195 [Polaribacter glomeratus]